MQDPNMQAPAEQAPQEEAPSMEELVTGMGEMLKLLAARMQADGAAPEQIEQVLAQFEGALKAIQGGGAPDQVGPVSMETGGRPAEQVL